MNPWLWRVPLLAVAVILTMGLLKWASPDYGFLIALVVCITIVPVVVEAWRRKDRS